MKNLRIGTGYDLHRLEAGGRCVLGGVEIPSDKGLRGHSDADCLTHAICDALLGAAGLPDIGQHFPDTEEAYRGIDSQELLRQISAILRDLRYKIVNADATVIAETPKLASHRSAMIATLAESMDISPAQVNVKATTNEGVDAIGRGEAIAAHAVCLLIRGTP